MRFSHITIGSLFSGIGGLDLGIEKALPGAETIFQIEQNEYCRKILAKHWPLADRRFTDVKDEQIEQHLPRPDVVVGGFPCTDISHANKDGRGLEGKASGLWWSMHRIIRSLRPRYVVAENVAVLNRRGIDKVIFSMAQSGYSRCIWDIISARAVGGSHGRDRMFLIFTADTDCNVLRQQPGRESPERWSGAKVTPRHGVAGDATYADGTGFEKQRGSFPTKEEYSPVECSRGWQTLSDVCGTTDGVPHRMDRLKALGNAVCPPVSYVVGLELAQIIKREEERDAVRNENKTEAGLT